MAASLLTDETLTLTNLPRVTDVETMLGFVEPYGVAIAERGPRHVVLDASKAENREAAYDTVRRMRATVMPGEDPLTLDTPEQAAELILPLCLPSWNETGKLYDYPTRTLLSFRAPA